MRRLNVLCALATFIVSAAAALQDADFATPKRSVDYLHMDLRLTMTSADIKARRIAFWRTWAWFG